MARIVKKIKAHLTLLKIFAVRCKKSGFERQQERQQRQQLLSTEFPNPSESFFLQSDIFYCDFRPLSNEGEKEKDSQLGENILMHKYFLICAIIVFPYHHWIDKLITRKRYLIKVGL